MEKELEKRLDLLGHYSKLKYKAQIEGEKSEHYNACIEMLKKQINNTLENELIDFFGLDIKNMPNEYKTEKFTNEERIKNNLKVEVDAFLQEFKDKNIYLTLLGKINALSPYKGSLTIEGIALEKLIEEQLLLPIKSHEFQTAENKNRILVIDINYLIFNGNSKKGDIEKDLEDKYGCKVFLIDSPKQNMQGNNKYNHQPIYFI